MMSGALLPNLGAEEGDDWVAFEREPSVRAAARLWSLLFDRDTALHHPVSDGRRSWTTETCEETWPSMLGEAPREPVFPWLAEVQRPIPWLNTTSLETTAVERFGQRPVGPPAELVARLHDKAFALESALALDLLPRPLDSMLHLIEPTALAEPDRLVESLDALLAGWPAWTARRYTLKPRFGSSGRGRVAGAETLDTSSVRGALPRLERLGGAILEPWLDRATDLSVVFHLATPGNEGLGPTILGSLEMITTPSGLYRGHCGEVDSRGRVFSGHRFDEALRADAAAIAQRAGGLGFFGPCGVDAFTYRQPDARGTSGEERERLRSIVEFNARATMGLVAIGLVRRALPHVREDLDLVPGTRRAFLQTFVPPNEDPLRERLIECCGADVRVIDLARPVDSTHTPTARASAEPTPILLFGSQKSVLRDAHREVLGC